MSYLEVGTASLSRALSGHSSVCVVFSHSRTAIRRAHPCVVMVVTLLLLSHGDKGDQREPADGDEACQFSRRPSLQVCNG